MEAAARRKGVGGSGLRMDWMRQMHPLRLAGPVFDKEMRTSSRRRRTYVLRTLYLALLVFLVGLVWMDVVRWRSYQNPVYQISRMSEAGRIITSFLVWFQFVAAQIVIVVSLSTAISEEIYHRTLGTLMTTPITSAQIVLGKLFSRLLIVMQLVALAFPALGIVQVFGGVPWMFVFSSLYLTITTTILTGSISLLWSVFTRRAYAAIIGTVLTAGAAFGLSAFLFFIILELTGWYKTLGEQSVCNFFYCTNPYATFIMNTIAFVEPGGLGKIVHHWFFNGMVMLGISTVLIFTATKLVRRAALAQIAGDAATTVSKTKKAAVLKPSLRSVKGSAMMWKEMCSPILGRRTKRMVWLILLGVMIMFAIYGLMSGIRGNPLKYSEFQAFCMFVFMGLGTLFSLIIPATAITTEKESGSWQILLASPLTERQILWAKYLGALRRCLPAWGFLFLHLIVFVYFGIIHPAALLLMPLVAAGTAAFLTATGVCFSSRFRRTTMAVVWNISLAAAVWLVLPFMIIICADIFHWKTIEYGMKLYMDTNPFVQAAAVMLAAVGKKDFYFDRFNWIGLRPSDGDVLVSVMWICFVMAGYLLLSWLIVWWTTKGLRKRI